MSRICFRIIGCVGVAAVREIDGGVGDMSLTTCL